jgi:hypothetical protein
MEANYDTFVFNSNCAMIEDKMLGFESLLHIIYELK